MAIKNSESENLIPTKPETEGIQSPLSISDIKHTKFMSAYEDLSDTIGSELASMRGLFNFDLTEITQKDIMKISVGIAASFPLQFRPGHRIAVNLKSSKKIGLIDVHDIFYIKLIGRYRRFTTTAEGELDAFSTLLLMSAPDGNRFAKEDTLYSLYGAYSEYPEPISYYLARYAWVGMQGGDFNWKYIKENITFGNEEAIKLGIINKVI